MELTESIESLNNQLINLFGIDTITGQAIWRISWSDTQFEKRRMDCTPSGIALVHPQVFEVPKYPYVKAKYVLERLVIVPRVNMTELPGTALSYEPMWVFQDDKGKYIPPIIGACKFIIDLVYAAMSREGGGMAQYVESEENTTKEGREHRVKKLQDELFGNETNTGDALAYREGIVVPHPMVKKES